MRQHCRFGRKLFIPILLLWSRLSVAESSPIASLYTQATHGRSCFQVSRQDLEKAGFQCYQGQPIKKFGEFSWKIYEWNVFQLAAERQLLKNKCMNQRITALKDNPEKLDKWIRRMATTWMGRKKTQLMLNYCHTQILSKIDPAERKRVGTRQAYAKALERQKTPKETGQKQPSYDLVENCLNDKKRQEMEMAESLFLLAQPIISKPEFFEIAEKHRDMIVNSRTQETLKDSELIDIDLRKLKFMKPPVISESFRNQIKESMNKLVNERNAISEGIQRGRMRSGIYLTDKVRDFIFEDDTLYETMNLHQLIKDEEELSNAAFCLLTQYEPDPVGEIASTVIETLFLGTGLAGFLTKGKAAVKAFGITSTMKGVQTSINKCASSSHQATKLLGRTPLQDLAEDLRENVHDKLGFEFFDMEDVPALTEDCKKLTDENLHLNAKYDSNCITDTILEFAAMKYTVPLEVYMER